MSGKGDDQVKEKERCPQVLDIQAFCDGEETALGIRQHLKDCIKCRSAYQDLKALCSAADRLSSSEVLPAGFQDRLQEKLEPAPFPAGQVTVAIFALALAAVFVLEPGFINWWLSVGITLQVSLLIDFSLELYYLGHNLGPAWVIAALMAIVGVELMILLKIRKVEGYTNAC